MTFQYFSHKRRFEGWDCYNQRPIFLNRGCRTIFHWQCSRISRTKIGIEHMAIIFRTIVGRVWVKKTAEEVRNCKSQSNSYSDNRQPSKYRYSKICGKFLQLINWQISNKSQRRHNLIWSQQKVTYTFLSCKNRMYHR